MKSFNVSKSNENPQRILRILKIIEETCVHRNTVPTMCAPARAILSWGFSLEFDTQGANYEIQDGQDLNIHLVLQNPSRQQAAIPTTGTLIAGNPPTQDSHHMPRNHSADNLIDKEQDGAGVCLCVWCVRPSVCLSVCLSVFAWCLCMVSEHGSGWGQRGSQYNTKNLILKTLDLPSRCSCSILCTLKVS